MARSCVRAAFQGLVGLKPTVGLVFTFRHHPDRAAKVRITAGPMARSVSRCRLLLLNRAGGLYDPDDPGNRAAQIANLRWIYTQFSSNRDGLQGVRIGVMRQNTAGIFTRECRRVRVQPCHRYVCGPGARSSSTLPTSPTQGQFDADEHTVLLYEFKDGINRYLAKPRRRPRRNTRST